MTARANWAATAVGTAVGTGGWLLGLDKAISPSHPMLALLFVTLAATIATSILMERAARG